MIQLQLFNGLHVARLLACTQRQAIVGLDMGSAQRVPEPDPLPGISFDTRPDLIQF